MPDLDAVPTAAWPLSDLTAFVRGLIRRSAADAWRIGRAVNLAKEKHPREFEKWLKQVGLNKMTAWRYRQIAENYRLTELAGRSIFDVQIEAGINTRIASAPITSRTGNQLPITGGFSWEVPPKHNVSSIVETVRLAAETLEEFHGKITPALARELEALTEAIDKLTAQK